MLEMNKVHGFVAGLALVGGLVAFAPSADAAITFPGRQEQSAEIQESQRDPDLPVIPQLEEMEAEAKAHQQTEAQQPMQKRQVARYTSAIAKVEKDASDLEAYAGKNLDDYFQTVGIKHGSKYYLYCADPQTAMHLKDVLERSNFKVEEVGDKVSKDVDEYFAKVLGTEELWGMQITYKDPNHKSWLEKNGMAILGGALSIFGL